MPQLRKLMPRYSLDLIIDAVADVFNITKDQILEKGRKNNLARDIAIYFSKVYSGTSGVEIAHRYGMRSGSAITMRYKAATKKIEGSRRLELKVNLIKERIMKN
jgi:chromosomal replication initiation ATPase DnaA